MFNIIAASNLTEIDRGYVGRIKRGEVNFTLKKLHQYAELLQCDVHKLLS